MFDVLFNRQPIALSPTRTHTRILVRVCLPRSSRVLTYNPREIIANLRMMMAGEEPNPMLPWFRGFTGSVTEEGKKGGKYRITGTLEKIDDVTLEITELPVCSFGLFSLMIALPDKIHLEEARAAR